MYLILVPGPASGQFCQSSLAKFLAGFLDLAKFSIASLHADYLQLKVMKPFLSPHHLRDLMV